MQPKWTQISLALACAILALLLLLDLAGADQAQQSAASKAKPTKVTPARARVRAGALKRVINNVAARAIAATKSVQQPARKTKRLPIERREDGADASSRQFQARMIHADSQTGADSAGGPDSWQPHSLVPIFADQEQGDEMVALASDDVEPVRMFAANKSAGEPVDHFARQIEKLSGEQARALPKNLPDEYYPDEEELDEEELATRPTEHPVRKDSPPKFARIPKQLQQPHQQQQQQQQQQPTPPPRSPANQEQPQQSYFDQSLGRPSDSAANNRSTPGRQLPAANETGWQPTSIRKQQRQQSDEQPQKGSSAKLVELFGSGESAFNRADVAIEYLKNMLKNRQSQRNTTEHSSGSGKHSGDGSYMLQDKNTGSLLRLGSFASKINHILNVSAPTQNETIKIAQEQHHHKQHHQHQVQEANRVLDAPPAPIDAATGSFLSQAADAKFSINDARTTANLDQIYSLTTTKQPEQSHTLAKQPANANQGNLANQDQSQVGFQNGTPLGGDYIESLDDYPRNSQSPHMAIPFMANAESAVQPVRYQPEPRAKLDQPPSPDSLVAMKDEWNQKLHPQQQAESQPSTLTQMTSYHSPAQFKPFQHHVPGVPTSSRFFQLQHPNADYPLSIPISKIAQANQTEQSSRVEDARQQYTSPVRQEQPELLQQQYPQQQLPPFSPPPQQQYPQLQYLHQQQQQPQPEQQSISSKMYGAEQPIPNQAIAPEREPVLSQASLPSIVPPIPHYHQQHAKPIEEPASSQPAPPANVAPKFKPPKIVSYNYFESPAENGESELVATNYQLGDALYSSNGGMEHSLSQSELDAIQNQFMTVEHQVVPMNGEHRNPRQSSQNHHNQHPQTINLGQPANGAAPYDADQDANLAGLLSGLRPNNMQPEMLQKLSSPVRQAEEALRGLASDEEQQMSMVSPSQMSPLAGQQGPAGAAQDRYRQAQEAAKASELDVKKKKSLIVYLNHPRPVDMSKVSSAAEGYSLAQSIGEQSMDFISAKEFDSHGLSKDSKHLDISNLHGLGEVKDSQDKDGLSVVVIGDAYKYKKIVLLISSKTGGLKFIPMVKDMKKKK